MKTKTLLFGLIIFAIATTLGTIIRLYPLHHFQPSDSSERAGIYVIGQLRKQVVQKVEETHPELSPNQKETLVKEFLNEMLQKDRGRISEAIKQVSESIYADSRKAKSFSFLLASDSYYFYDLTQKIAEDGHYSDQFKGSKFLYKLMMAPTGHWEPITWHPYVGYFTYKIFQLFNKDVPLMFAIGATSLFTSALCLLPFLYICRTIGCSWIVTLVASIFFNLAPIFVKRSTFAWFDNDIYNIFFPLLILALLLKIFSIASSKRMSIILGVVISIIIFIYAHFWQGWVFLLGVLFIACLVRLIYHFLPLYQGPNQIKNVAALWLTIFLGSFGMVAIFFGPGEFFILFKEGWKALSNFLVPQLSMWPDLYISVGELQKTSFDKLVGMCGGWIMLIIGIIGMGYFIIKALKNSSTINPNWVIVLTTYFLTTFYLASGAQRFFLLFLVPLAINFAYGLELISKQLSKLLTALFSPKLKSTFAISTVCSILLLSLILFPWVTINHKIRGLLNPIYNETWDKALVAAREKTPPNSVITAWWPPGHFIKATARRHVNFDGASINYPQSYWIANFFMETDEKKALGILRMLNNSGNQAADYLLSQGFDIVSTVSILNEIIKLDSLRARLALKVFLKDPQKASYVLSLTHQTPPPSYVLLYNEFVENNIEMRFIGNWNFKRIQEINKDPQLLAQVPARGSRKYIDFLWTLAGGPHKYSGPLKMISRKDDAILFEHNLTINTKTYECYIKSPKYGEGVPTSIFYVSGNNVVEKKLKGDKPYSVVFLSENDHYQAILMDEHLAKSMLVQLYFFDAKGLQYFHPFVNESSVTKHTTIKIFEIDWDKFNKSL